MFPACKCTACCTSASCVLFPLVRACVGRLLTLFHAHRGAACLTRCSDASGGTIKLADGRQLQYDWLVLALGSSTSTFGIPGVKEYAYAFNDYNDSMRVKPHLRIIQHVIQQATMAGHNGNGTEICVHTVAHHQKRSVLLQQRRPPQSQSFCHDCTQRSHVLSHLQLKVCLLLA